MMLAVFCRAEELQRRLEEVMVDATSRQSLEELFRPPLSTRLGEDSGSVRSWSASNSGLGTDVSAQQGSAFGFTAEDVRLMIHRLTEAQQENALLKEKVAHLEEGNAAQVRELIFPRASSAVPSASCPSGRFPGRRAAQQGGDH